MVILHVKTIFYFYRTIERRFSIMDEETEVYTIYQRVTQIEKRHVTAPKGLTFNQLSDWVDENGVGDLLDIDELDNDMVSADYEDGSHVKRKWAN